jgi:hypothetical protein
MKLNCKPGDMAIVVSAYHRPENIGRIGVASCRHLIADFFVDGKAANGTQIAICANRLIPVWNRHVIASAGQWALRLNQPRKLTRAIDLVVDALDSNPNDLDSAPNGTRIWPVRTRR